MTRNIARAFAIALGVATVSATVIAPAAFSQDKYPTRPVEMIVPWDQAVAPISSRG